jgi:ATP-dependent protease HslVU (ClpYQ) peptidase subunit
MARITLHDLEKPVIVANLNGERQEEAKRDPLFRHHCDLAKEWSEDSRYRRHGSETAQALVNAIGDRNHGVIFWIKRHW